MRKIMSHDLGTTGNKATLFSEDGQMQKSVVCSYPVRFFNDNWAEQDPNDWWKAFCDASKQLLRDEDPSSVKVISFSGQMMGCVCVDQNGNALRDAIIWADMRAADEELFLSGRIDPEKVYRITGHKLSRSYSLEKLMWIKNNEPDIYARTHKLLNAKDYIVSRLTGGFYSDYSDASGTNALDLIKGGWSDEIIEAAGLAGELFPELLPSTSVVGEVSKKSSEECGLHPGTLIVLGGGDGSCASVGAGSISEGVTYNCLGSSSWISTVSKEPFFDSEMRTVTWAHTVPDLFIPSGTMQTAGAAFAWAKDRLGQHETAIAKERGVSPYELISEQIQSSEPGANALLFLPYLLGERCPRWNSNARASFVGLKMEHTNGDMFRSVVEGVAMNMRVILQILRNAVEINEMILVGGLAKGNVEQQIFADIYDMAVRCPQHLEEATSIGAAVIAGVGAEILPDFESVKFFNRIVDTKAPAKKNAEFYDKLFDIFNQTYANLTGIFEQLAQLKEK